MVALIAGAVRCTARILRAREWLTAVPITDIARGAVAAEARFEVDAVGERVTVIEPLFTLIDRPVHAIDGL